MKTAVAAPVIALAAIASAQLPARFSLIAGSSNPALHFKTINAAGQQLWIGKPTASYCPPVVGDTCKSVSNTTSFAGGETGMGMNVIVPGGQAVYVSPSGLIKYTIAHSAMMDPGSVTTGFAYHAQVVRGLGLLTWSYEHRGGFIACADQKTTGAYSVQTTNGTEIPAGCSAIDLLVPEQNAITSATAWQFT